MRKLTYQEIFSSRPTLAQIDGIKRHPMYTVLENVRSLYNVGSIFRTSDAVLLQKIFLAGFTGYPPRREIDKTALGAVDSVPWEYTKEPEKSIEILRSKQVRIIALEHTTTSMAHFEFSFTYPFCLILGNEVDGVSESLLGLCDDIIEIPMFGLKQSLNVSVAYGVVMYHALQQYLLDQGKNK